MDEEENKACPICGDDKILTLSCLINFESGEVIPIITFPCSICGGKKCEQ